MAIERRKPRDRAKHAGGVLPDTVDRVAYLREALQHAESMVTQAEEARSWQAAISGKRLALQVRDELDAALAKAAAPDDSMSDEQLLAIMVQAVSSIPAQHLERLEDAIAIRRGASPVRLVETA
jgi:hypothetical protein